MEWAVKTFILLSFVFIFYMSLLHSLPLSWFLPILFGVFWQNKNPEHTLSTKITRPKWGSKQLSTNIRVLH